MRFADFSRVAFAVLLASSLSLAQWDAPDSSRAAPNAPKTNLSERQQLMYRDMARTGNTFYTVGQVAAWSGVAAYVIGSFSGAGELAGIGFLATTVGIPVMGYGAGRVQDAGLALNPQARGAGGAGWPLYWAGWAAQVAGFVVIGASAEEDEYGDTYISDGAAITGISLIAGGLILHYAAWFEFSRRRDIGNINLASLSLLPTVHVADGRVEGAGAKLLYGF